MGRCRASESDDSSYGRQSSVQLQRLRQDHRRAR
ncbi:hypothetical protein QK293_16185 [Pseudomonas sp. AL03]|nr:hypothetical protein [Pseudomonas sp. AL03]MDI3273799.1 hypothetical protein [Pseudomonas sp. AL03]